MMKTRVIFLGAIAVLFASKAFAANAVRFSAGEHDGYSRIVIVSGAGEVKIQQSGRDVEIYFRDAVEDFEFSDVNVRRKAHRVLNASTVPVASGSLVQLQLNCDCRVESNQVSDGKWVLDVYDSGAKSETIQTPSVTRPEPAKTAAVKPVRKDRSEAGKDNEDNVDSLSVEQAHSRMVDLLQQAANEGLIRIRTDKPGADQIAEDAQAGGAAEPVLEAEPAPAADIAAAKAAPIETPPHACLGDDEFFIDSDRFEDNPLIEIAGLKSQLAEAPIEEQRKIVEELAGGFLAIGFGEEALALLVDGGQENVLMADLARVVAEKPISRAGILLNAVGCTGAHALWQAAASGPGAAAERIGQSGDAIAALPSRLRALLATRIAQKMIDAGDWSAAQNLFDIANAASEVPSPKLQFVSALLREHDGALDESHEMLLDLAGQGNDASKDALLTLAEEYADGRAEPHDGYIDDIGALAKTDRGSRAGADAAMLEADLWADAGNIEASMMLLRSAADSSPAQREIARRKARGMLSEAYGSDDEEIRISALAAFLDHRDFVDAPGRAGQFQQQTAQAALGLGLPNVAFDILKNRSLSGDPEMARLKTVAALEANDPDAALAAAAGHTDDPDFASLVVRANMQQRNYYAALAAASALPESNRKAVLAVQSAWRAGDWESAARAFRSIDPNLMGENMAVQFALAAYMTGAREIPPAVEAVLKKQGSDALEGVRSLFSDDADRLILERSRDLAVRAGDEIKLLEEVLGHG